MVPKPLPMITGLPLSSEDYGEQHQDTDEEHSSDVLTDSEDDGLDFAEVPKEFEQVVPRSLKRTYGLLVDGVVPDRRLKSRLDEQLGFLRAIIPKSYPDERNSVLLDAYKYIEKLQRRVKELHSELVADLHTARLRAMAVASRTSLPASQCPCQHPTVEVTRKEEGLKVHIVCDKRPGLLVAIMGALESNGVNVVQASFSCYPHLVFEAVSLEGEEDDEGTVRIYPRVPEEDLRTALIHAISQGRADSGS